jgi:N6-L-threonylcarbamoyladenine synthase
VSVFLGIDTSNYTTSLSLVENGRVLCNVKEPVFVAEGKVGVRQSDAVFSHTKNLPVVFERLRDCYDGGVTAVGYSFAPRDVLGSYMPCFLSGAAAAYAVCSMTGSKLFKFSHQRGHIYAALYSAGVTNLYDGEFVAFHVSGGTTEALHVKNREISKIGGTLDLTAGQLIDRTAVSLGLDFPGGVHIEKLALQAAAPKVKVSVKGLECNMSGGENKVKDMINAGVSQADIAAYVIEFVKVNLDKITENIIKEYGNIPLLFSGGVMSCSIIKKYFEDKYGAYFAEPAFSSDNAAGIALLAEREYFNEQ